MDQVPLPGWTGRRRHELRWKIPISTRGKSGLSKNWLREVLKRTTQENQKQSGFSNRLFRGNFILAMTHRQGGHLRPPHSQRQQQRRVSWSPSPSRALHEWFVGFLGQSSSRPPHLNPIGSSAASQGEDRRWSISQCACPRTIWRL